MNWLDYFFLIIVALSVIGGFVDGFARVGIGFIAVVTGIILGFWFYGIPAAWLSQILRSQMAANVLGFFIVCGCVVAVGGLIGWVLSKLFKWVGLSWLNRLMGAAFGVVRGALIVVAAVTVLMAFAPKPPPSWIVNSRLVPYALDASEICAAIAPKQVKDAFHDSVSQVRKLWEEHLKERHGKPKEDMI